MAFEKMIQQCWADHANDTVAVAAKLEIALELVDDTAKAGQYAMIVNHVIGEHLNDWEHAATLVGTAVGKVKEDASAAGVWIAYAVSLFMAAEISDAMIAESRAVQLAKGNPIATLVRVRMQLVTGLMGLKRREEASRLYVASLDLAALNTDKAASDRACAVTSNNLASELAELENRTQAETTLMLKAAHAAREYWLKAGDWMNDERADFLLAICHNAAGQHEKALDFAKRGLSTIAANGQEDVDAAFLHLCAAKAQRQLGRRKEHSHELSLADALAGGFEPDTKKWFDTERAKAS